MDPEPGSQCWGHTSQHLQHADPLLNVPELDPGGGCGQITNNARSSGGKEHVENVVPMAWPQEPRIVMQDDSVGAGDQVEESRTKHGAHAAGTLQKVPPLTLGWTDKVDGDLLQQHHLSRRQQEGLTV